MQDSENCNKTALLNVTFAKKSMLSLITNTELVIQSKSKFISVTEYVQSIHPEQPHKRVDVHATVELLRQSHVDKFFSRIKDASSLAIFVLTFSCITAQTF